jgi:hypothetical protein
MSGQEREISIHISDLRERAARAEERSAIAVDRLNAHAHRLKHHMDLMLAMEGRITKRLDRLENIWNASTRIMKYGLAIFLAGAIFAGKMTAESASALFRLFAP